MIMLYDNDKALRKSFKDNFYLSQNVSVDEAMVKGKGKNPVKQFQPNKPIKRGSKVWSLADSITGYLYDFQIYQGKQSNTTELGLGTRVVCDLMLPDLADKNHIVNIVREVISKY